MFAAVVVLTVISHTFRGARSSLIVTVVVSDLDSDSARAFSSVSSDETQSGFQICFELGALSVTADSFPSPRP